MLIRIAVADEDIEYIHRLTKRMESFEDVNLSIYTNRSSLEVALQTKYFDVLLFTPGLFDGQVSLNPSTIAIMLFDDEIPVPESCNGFAKLRKYQCISVIYQQILEFYSEVCGEMPQGILGQKGVAVWGFYSPAGGVGKTTTALMASTRLANSGYRTLYLNMEDIAAEDCYLPQNGGKGISDIVNILGSNVNFTMKVQSILQKKTENLYYFNHFDNLADLEEISEKEISELIQSLERSGLFDFILIDMGVAITNRINVLFEILHKIILVEKPDIVAGHKMKRFLSQTHILNEYGNKMVRVLNFDTGRTFEADTYIPRIGTIPYISNPDTGRFIDILAEGEGAQFIDMIFKGEG